MAIVPSTVGALDSYCQRILGKNGRLTTAMAGFIPRQAQLDLALAIADAIDKGQRLVAEAGTGTGKTFAYLTPSLKSGKKIVISTATKTLQDQLYNKDLPHLIEALGLSVRVQNLKGRANYLCRHRLHLHSTEGRFSDTNAVHDLQYIMRKLPRLTEGERSELPEVREHSAVWPYATSTVENCLGLKCDHHETCFLVKARKRALTADVVIINHHLFFADSQLKEEGFGELLPGADVVIFDEAHQLESIATHFNGEQFSTRQLTDTIHELIQETLALESVHKIIEPLLSDIETCSAGFIEILAQESKKSWDDVYRLSAFEKHWQTLAEVVHYLIEQTKAIDTKEQPNLARCIDKIALVQLQINQFNLEQPQKIRWVERFKQSVVFHLTPLNVALSFSQLLNKEGAAYIFLSATLAVAGRFDCFTDSLGLKGSQTLLLESPFNYQQQALLYLPRDLPDPKQSHYYAALVTKVVPIINALQGRCFFLFTSHRALKEVAELLEGQLNYPLLVQGEEAKPILLERFRNLGNAVLLGTATFWEGVDVKGDTLAAVFIDKLPFSSPADPVNKSKLAHIEKQGLSSFNHYTLPDAILTLKQGVGRLIRDATDRGILMIADPRLTSRAYGAEIFLSLPPLPKTRDEKRVMAFIEHYFPQPLAEV